ncbi:hypothetical protein ACIGO6_15825 [Streptomyces sp. NPDC053750]|uniref:hypothetical protein n=1 Tax=Streptomyces sp. NPDC053750 TaxID=3365714 RepID=UPI0037CEEAFD
MHVLQAALRRNISKIATRLSIIFAVTLGTLSISPAAHAGGYGCTGSLIDTYNVIAYSDGKKVYGYHYLYYNSSTGVNCGVTVANQTGGYGTSKPMAAEISACTSNRPGDLCQSVVSTDSDRGYYKSYAGPVSVKAAGRCIAIFGYIEWKGHTAFVETNATHCG